MTDKELQVSVFVLHHRGTGIATRTRDHQSPHLVKVRRDHRLRECKLAREDWRDTNLIGFDVDVGGDNRTCSVVDTLALVKR